MPVADPTNPYAPPEADPPPRPRRHRRWPGSETVSRITAVVAGFSLVADPSMIPVVGRWAAGLAAGRLAVRVVGLLIMGAAFLPWRVGGRPDQSPDHL